MKSPSQAVKEWTKNRIQLKVGITILYFSRRTLCLRAEMYQKSRRSNPLYRELRYVRHVLFESAGWSEGRIRRWVRAFFAPMHLAQFETVSEIRSTLNRKAKTVWKANQGTPEWMQATLR